MRSSPDEGCGIAFGGSEWKRVFGAFMPPTYDLILLDHGQFQIETVEVKDASDAWRLGRERYPLNICGVVCQDPSAASTGNPR